MDERQMVMGHGRDGQMKMRERERENGNGNENGNGDGSGQLWALKRLAGCQEGWGADAACHMGALQINLSSFAV